MNSINDLWSTVLDMISSKYTSTSIATWFSDCKPVAIKESTFIIYTPTDFKRKIITNRFGAALEEVLTDLFSSPFTVQILCGDETLETSSSFDDVLPEMEGYTFDNFIVGNSNKFAHAAAVAVTDKPGQTYNPLFIYGNSGLGKTHLLLAIGHDLLNKNPNLNVAYIKGDDFTNELIHAISRSTTNDFHEKYRNVELLLVDDIQFIAGKTARKTSLPISVRLRELSNGSRHIRKFWMIPSPLILSNGRFRMSFVLEHLFPLRIPSLMLRQIILI